MVRFPAAVLRVLRARRVSHERRWWARCARERITSVGGGEAAVGGGRLISMRWCRTRWMQARRCSLRLQSRQRSGAEPTWSGCSSTLTWRGFAVARPFHWHCSRRGQGRQLRVLAPYTTRRLPSASRRCSCVRSGTIRPGENSRVTFSCVFPTTLYMVSHGTRGSTASSFQRRGDGVA